MATGAQKQGLTGPVRLDSAAIESRRFDTWAIFAATVLALLARFLTLPATTRAGTLRLLSMDDYGHLRRAMATLSEFPRVPAFDPYLHHPEGAIWIWPPGFDFGLATLGRAIFGASPTLGEMTLVAALVPPILGALSIWPLFVFCRTSLGSVEARWAVIFYALNPAAVVWSSFGHADQHCAEALALVLVLAAFARVFRAGADGSVAREDWAWICAAAAALFAAVLIWQGAVFLVPVIALAAVIGRRAFPAAAAFLLAAALITVFAWSYPGPLTYLSFGRFQPLFLVLWAGLLALAAQPRWGVALATVAGLAAALLWPPVSDGVRHLLSASSGGDPVAGGYQASAREWLELIFEYRPLFHAGLAAPLAELSGGLLAAVPVAGWWGYRMVRIPSERIRLALPLIAFMTLGLMTLSQRRYVYYSSVVAAIALAVAIVEIARRLPRGRWLAGAMVVLALAPTVRPLARQPAVGAAAGEDVFRTLETLGALDPPETEPFRTSAVTAGEVEGVLAPWSLGHLVTLFTARPAVADNFGYGFDRQSWIYTAPPESDREVVRRLAAWNCRYLITADLDPVIGAYARAAGHESVAPERMLVNRLHRSNAVRPVEFLELVLVSESVRPAPDGSLIPLLKVFRITAPDKTASVSLSSLVGLGGAAAIASPR